MNQAHDLPISSPAKRTAPIRMYLAIGIGLALTIAAFPIALFSPLSIQATAAAYFAVTPFVVAVALPPRHPFWLRWCMSLIMSVLVLGPVAVLFFFVWSIVLGPEGLH